MLAICNAGEAGREVEEQFDMCMLHLLWDIRQLDLSPKQKVGLMAIITAGRSNPWLISRS